MNQSVYACILLFSFMVLILLGNPIFTTATNFTDPPNDVWLQYYKKAETVATWQQGDFVDAIDIVSVTVKGSSVTIECQGNIARWPTEWITIEASEVVKQATYLVLFNDNKDSTNWEAGIAYMVDYTWSYIGTIDESELTMRINPTAWPRDDKGQHHELSENMLTLKFPEYSNVETAEILVCAWVHPIYMTGPPVDDVSVREWVWDWAPNTHEHWGKEPEGVIESVAELQPRVIFFIMILLVLPITLFSPLRSRKRQF